MTKKSLPKPDAQKDKLDDYRPDPDLKVTMDYDDHSLLAMERWVQNYELGMAVAREREQKGSVVQYLLNRAKAEAATSLDQLITTNLGTKVGVEIAQALQSRIIRYKNMVNWLEEAIALGEEASMRLEEEIDEPTDTDDGNTTDE